MAALLPADPDVRATSTRRLLHGLLALAVVAFAMVNGALISSYFHVGPTNGTFAAVATRRLPSTTAPLEVETTETELQTSRTPQQQQYMAAHPLFRKAYATEDTLVPASKETTPKLHVPVEDCREPECLWYFHHLETKLNRDVDPCDDFYAHACSPKWFAASGKSTFQMTSVEKLMSCMDMNLRVEKHSPLRWLSNSAFLYDACVTGNGSKSLRRLLLRRKERPSTTRRPTRPAVVFKIGLQEMMPGLHREFLEDLKVNPLAKVYMAPQGAGNRRYVPYVDSPDLLIKRFFLRHPDRTEGDYQKLIQETFREADNPVAVSKKIVHIEKKLSSVVSSAFHRPASRLLTADEIVKNATFRWLAHVFPASYSSRYNVRILDQNYVAHLVDVLKHTCTLKDLRDYFNFRTLVHYSPFLNIAPLIPLSYDESIEDVPARVQGCLRIVENTYKQGMRMLGTEALGGNFGLWRIPFEYEISSLFEDVKKTLSKYAGRWFSPSTADLAVRKIHSMELAYLGSKITTPAFYAQNTPEFRDMRDFSRLIADTISRDFNDTSNLDFMHRSSIFATEVEYNPDTNSLYVPHGLVTLPVLLSEKLHPIFVPIIGAKILHGVMASIDRRGSETLFGEDRYRTWWSSRDRQSFHNRSSCFRVQLDRNLKKIYPAANDRAFLERFVADNAIVDPLYDIYKKRMSRRYPHGIAWNGERVKEDRAFFYAYAMGFCSRPGLEKVQVKYKDSVPARVTVNNALANTPRFQRTFQCRPGTRMAPREWCSYWK